jgi:glycosyltransferase involved in cell wall biosynthesis
VFGNPDKMTILQLIPSLEAGGAERATVDIAEALTKAGHRALVISAGGKMVPELEAKGGHHFTWPVDSKNPLLMLKNGYDLARFIRNERVSIVHARSRAPAWSAWMAAKYVHVPFVTTFHAAYKSRSRLKDYYNAVMAKGDRIIAISHFIAEHIRRQYHLSPPRVTTIPRGIDFSVYDPGAITAMRKEKFLQDAGVPAGVPIILIPGRLSPIKGQEAAIRALALLTQPFFAVIVGPDQGRKEYSRFLYSLAQELGLKDRLAFLSSADLPAAYSVSSLVLSPSQVPEGFGRVPVEAQAFGVPVIATSLGATSETVKSGQTGWLVPLGDEAALATAIDTALRLTPEEKQRMSEAARQYVRERFDLNGMCTATLKVYADVLTAGQE